MSADLYSSLRCPVCEGQIEVMQRSLKCVQGHHFDQAKQGYFNLLPVQHKSSKRPGDDKQMIQARRQFLAGGFYEPFSQALNQAIFSATEHQPTSVLDAGCGEGYYSENLLKADEAKQLSLIGLDISKEAIIAASKRHCDALWLVASAAKAPLNSASLDVIFSVFTPLAPDELHRLLKPQGTLITASAGQKHLLELRERIYDEVREKPSSSAKLLESHFDLQQSQAIQFAIELSSREAIHQLLMMTPHFWRAKNQTKSELLALTELQINVDIQLDVFTPKSL